MAYPKCNLSNIYKPADGLENDDVVLQHFVHANTLNKEITNL